MSGGTQHKLVYLKDYKHPDFRITRVNLLVDLFEDHALVTNEMSLEAWDAASPASDLWLDGHDLKLESFELNGKSVNPEVQPNGLWLRGVPAKLSLKIVTRLEPHKNTALEGLYKSSGIFCTQCEAQGFRRITYYLDRPDVMATYTTTIRAEKARYPHLLSNGNLKTQKDLAGGRHEAVWEDPFPKPCYLFALVAGDLDVATDSFKTKSGRNVEIRIYVNKGNLDKTAHAIQSVKKSMKWEERVYGLEYDLDIYMIVAVDDFNAGAMENKGLNIFNSKYVLAKPETATDADYFAIEGTIAHEYFHNWTGNRVTCRDWFQLSLKEGLTVFRDQEFSSDLHSRGVTRVDDVIRLRNSQFNEDSGPTAHPVRPSSYIAVDNFYTATVYNKGAEVIRMLQTVVGHEAFIKGTNLYLSRNDGKAATIEDFVGAMADASGLNMDQFMRWYEQAGTPVVKVETQYHPSKGTFEIQFHQSCAPTPGQPEKAPFHIPLRMALFSPDGHEMELKALPESTAQVQQGVVHLKSRDEKVVFQTPEKPIPSLLRGFSAPVRLDYSMTRDELLFLKTDDTDPFCRWEAAQRLALMKIEAVMRAEKTNQNFEISEDYLEAFRTLLDDEVIEPAFLARMLVLPSETYIGQLQSPIDPHAIHRARELVSKKVAHYNKARFREIYDMYWQSEQSSLEKFDSLAVGRRAVRNVCLNYLVATGEKEAIELAWNQLVEADGMTDEIAALAALSRSDGPRAEEAMQRFLDRWKADPLVVNKWLSIQAASNVGDAVTRVRNLTKSEYFTITNPNRVYALVGGFAGDNPTQFHRLDGAGHDFLSEMLLELDSRNPQLAARIATPFARWKQYVPAVSDSMRGRLEKLVAHKGLSDNLFEIVSKSLGS